MTRARLAKLSKKDAREAIIEKAVEQFARRGYDRTSLESIADELGVTKGAIFYHFRKKTDLLFVIHEAFIDVLLRRAQAREGDNLGPTEELSLVFADILWLMEHMHDHVRVFFEEWRALDEDQAIPMRKKRDAYEGYVAEVYRRGVEQGIVRDIPARMRVFALFGMANWSYQWYRKGGELDHDAVARSLADMYLHGVAVKHGLAVEGDPPSKGSS